MPGPFPDLGITKRDVIDYYREVGEALRTAEALDLLGDVGWREIARRYVESVRRAS